MASPQTAPATQSPRFRARCAELAAERNLIGTCNWRGVGDGGRDVLTVPSRTRTTPHVVTWDQRFDQFRCDCRAAEHGRACSHIGAAADYVTRFLRTMPTERTGPYASTDPAVYAFHGYAEVARNNPHELGPVAADLAAFGLEIVPLPRIVPVLTASPRETEPCAVCGYETPADELIALDYDGAVRYPDYVCQSCNDAAMDAADPMNY